jgi:hypothetical protein
MRYPSAHLAASSLTVRGSPRMYAPIVTQLVTHNRPADKDVIRLAALYGVTGNEHGVSGWSNVRLPFEPRGDLRAYREELKAALRRMRPRHGEGLIATYGAPDHAFVDVENVALYNIGSGAYTI